MSSRTQAPFAWLLCHLCMLAFSLEFVASGTQGGPSYFLLSYEENEVRGPLLSQMQAKESELLQCHTLARLGPGSHSVRAAPGLAALCLS